MNPLLWPKEMFIADVAHKARQSAARRGLEMVRYRRVRPRRQLAGFAGFLALRVFVLAALRGVAGLGAAALGSGSDLK
jgi:hypothetical protein